MHDTSNYKVTLRASRLVCLLLLLTALRGVDGSVLPAGEYGFDGRYGLVLSQDSAGVWTRVALIDHGPGGRTGNGHFFVGVRFKGGIGALDVDSAKNSRAIAHAVWTMRPPAAQCAAVFATTNA